MYLNLPLAAAGKDIDTVGGVNYPDPYRWLETSNKKNVRDWQESEARLAARYVRDWPHYHLLEKRISELSSGRSVSVPRKVGKYWYWVGKDSNTGCTGLLMADVVYKDARLIYDSSMGGAPTTRVLSWFSPSLDGQILAVGFCDDGSEYNQILLIEISSGKKIPNAPQQWLMDNWTGGVCWLPDRSGFYFLALIGDREEFCQQLLFHSLLTGKQETVDIPGVKAIVNDYILITLSPQGHYLVAYQGLVEPRPVALCKLCSNSQKWTRFISLEKGIMTGFVYAETFIAITDIGADRGRVISIPLNVENPNDTSRWVELVPESEAVLRNVTLVSNYLYISTLVDTYSEIRIFDLAGAFQCKVPLPGRGALYEPNFAFMTCAFKGLQDEYLFGYSSFQQSWGVYSHRPTEKSLTILTEPQVKFNDVVVEDCEAISSDGVAIRYQCVRNDNLDTSTPQPTLLFAYGGFNVPLTNKFPNAIAAFIESGGVYVHCHIRGGGEFGRCWWERGRGRYKGNCSLDLYSVAENLIKKGQAVPETMAMTGGSNGGLLAGVALTQRPELWKVVIPRIPILDLVGALRDPYGRFAMTGELVSDPNDPDDLIGMAGRSAYHLIKSNINYPSVLISAGDSDPRCPAWHARKFGAYLQAENSGDNPILVHVHDNAGHGMATAGAIQKEIDTEWIAFTMKQLHMQPTPTNKDTK